MRKRKYTPTQMRIIKAYYRKKRKEKRVAKREAINAERIAAGKPPLKERVYTPVDPVTGRDNVIPESDEMPF